MFFALTPRRLETLRTLKGLTTEAGSAVHYSAVAAQMRISAWTAYDLLRELENLGLVVRRYVQAGRERAGGRSRILFAPAAEVLLSSEESTSALRLAFERFSAMSDVAAARDYVADQTSDLAFHMGFWLSRLIVAGRQGGEAAGTVLEGGAAPLQKAQTLAAMGLGAALARLGTTRLTSRVTAAGNRFSALLEESGERVADLIEASRRLEVT